MLGRPAVDRQVAIVVDQQIVAAVAVEVAGVGVGEIVPEMGDEHLLHQEMAQPCECNRQSVPSSVELLSLSFPSSIPSLK